MATDFIESGKTSKYLNSNFDEYNSIDLNQNNRSIRIKRSNNLHDEKTIRRQQWEEKIESASIKKCTVNSVLHNPNLPKRLELNIKSEYPEQNDKPWLRREKNSLNSSTLSLHITAYENAIETINAKNIGGKNKQNAIGKQRKNGTVFGFGKNFTISNSFEFPRQQENEDNNEPEVTGYKSSQKLYNPNDEVALTFNQLNTIFGTPSGPQRSSWRVQLLQNAGFPQYIESPRVLTAVHKLKERFSKDKKNKNVKKEDYGTTKMTIGYKSDWEKQHQLSWDKNESKEADSDTVSFEVVNAQEENMPYFGPEISKEKHIDLLIETFKENKKKLDNQKKYYQQKINLMTKQNCDKKVRKKMQKMEEKMKKLQKENKRKTNLLNKKGLSAAEKPVSRVIVSEKTVVPIKKRKIQVCYFLRLLLLITVIQVMQNKKEYDQEFKHLCVYLSWRFISDAGIVYALKMISKYLGIELRIPNPRTIGRWCEEAEVLIRLQTDEWFDENAKNLTIHTDETTLSGEKLQAQIFCKIVDGVKKYILAGLPKVADKGAATSLKSLMDSLRKSIKPLQFLSDDEIEHILEHRVGNITNSVSDRASPQKLFNKLLSAKTKNKINELFCEHHILASLYDVYLKSCLEDEKEKFNNPDLKNSTIKRAVEIISTGFGQRSNHPTSKTADWLLFAEETGVPYPVFPSKLGARWNVGPAICASLLQNRTHLLKFMRETNYAVEEYYAPLMKVLECPALIAQLHIGANLDQVLTGPWWTMIDKSDHVAELAAANFRIIEYLKSVAENPCLYSNETLFPLQTERTPRQDALRHTVTTNIPDGCFELASPFYTDIATYLEKQMMLILPDGEEMDANLKEQLASASGTNKVAEQVFGITSFLRSLSNSKSIERVTANVAAVKNGTVEWFENKTEEEKQAIIKAMKKTRSAFKIQRKKDKELMKEALATKIKTNQAQQQKKKPKNKEIDLDKFVGSKFHERWNEEEGIWMFGFVQKKEAEGFIVQFYGDEETYLYSSEYLNNQISQNSIIFID